ncbi:MAG: glycosyltransferase family 2 protein [Spirochaetaceae bacterium]|jgi:chlorobactene glucosyltransferase|nr:glycosyltransferase family 2 protein [Spirochaetaceae bacterium]
MEPILSFVSDVYFPVIVVLAFYFFILSLTNIFQMRRHTVPAEEILGGPMVSVLIPVRDEEENIENCLASLCDQSYQNYEILVIDDNSTDNTMNILKKMSRKNPKIRFFTGNPLPNAWYGKPYALQQLSVEARGDILIFTDADTIHRPSCISWAVTNINSSKADFISGYVGQKLLTFGERVTVPLMFFLTGFIIPLWMNSRTKSSLFSAAVGQFIAVKRRVFQRIGGFETIKKKTSEDMYLARYVKEQGYRTMFLDISGQVECRMYAGYRAAVEGIGKNIFDFLGKNTLIIFLIAFSVFFFLFLPFPLFFFMTANQSVYAVNLLVVNILYTLTWMILFLDRKIAWYYALLWPLMFLNLLYMASWSWFKTVSGQGFFWKGRVVT